jgi:acetylglutamate kinase
MLFSDIALIVGSKSMPSRVPGLSSDLFAAAVERVARFRNPTTVVKLGGSAMEDPAATVACLRSITALNLLGVPLVLVHGGGKPIDRAMAESGLTPRKVAGRRYTDDRTLAIVVRTLVKINSGIEEELGRLGCRATAVPEALSGEKLELPGPDGQTIDLGRVGKATALRSPEVCSLLGSGRVPIIPSLALDQEGQWLNVNADTAAAAVAGFLKAERTIFLTDTPGVLRDRNDPRSLLSRLGERECRELICSGVIDGGMVPKVEACFDALDAGAKAALILDGRVPFSLLDVYLHDSFQGTEIVR